MSAPPASPEYVAIQPAWRPITSTTITRSWLSAVVCSRSIASVAICTAVWKPNVKSVAERSLSIVFGTPTTLHAVARRACARRRACPRRRSRSARRRGRAASVAFTCAGPSSVLYGFVRDVPRIVPPRGSSPRTEPTRRSHRLARRSRRASRGGSRRSLWPYSPSPLRTTARITALSPGQSPPPVSMPIRMEPHSPSCPRPPSSLSYPAARPRPPDRCMDAGNATDGASSGAAVRTHGRRAGCEPSSARSRRRAARSPGRTGVGRRVTAGCTGCFAARIARLRRAHRPTPRALLRPGSSRRRPRRRGVRRAARAARSSTTSAAAAHGSHRLRPQVPRGSSAEPLRLDFGPAGAEPRARDRAADTAGAAPPTRRSRSSADGRRDRDRRRARPACAPFAVDDARPAARRVVPRVPAALPAARAGSSTTPTTSGASRSRRSAEVAGEIARRRRDGRRDRHHEPARDRGRVGPRARAAAATARSCGRTGAPRSAATSCAPPATSR